MPKYQLDEMYFDEIDSSDKAYWMGFIWCDGYVCKRNRGTLTSYEFKLSLTEVDAEHLDKFKECLSSDIPIRRYDISGFETKNKEVRLLIARKIFAEKLYSKYGLKPHRSDSSDVISKIPREYYRDFLRGVFDADGSIISRVIHYKSISRKEFSISLSATESLVVFFNDTLIREGLTETNYLITSRHEGRDGSCRSIRITGNNVVLKILNWLYCNNSASLSRKESSYIAIAEYMDEYRGEKCNV